MVRHPLRAEVALSGVEDREEARPGGGGPGVPPASRAPSIFLTLEEAGLRNHVNVGGQGGESLASRVAG